MGECGGWRVVRDRGGVIEDRKQVLRKKSGASNFYSFSIDD